MFGVMEDAHPEPSLEALAAQIAAFRAQDCSLWSGAARLAVSQDLGRMAQQLLGAWVDSIREADRDQAWREEGFSSAQSWVANTVEITEAEATRRVQAARLLHEQDLTRSEFDTGGLSAAQVEELARVYQNREVQYAEEEVRLLRRVENRPTATLRKTTLRWARDMDAEKVPPEPDEDHSWFQASRTFGGYLRTDGLFTPEDADVIEAALREAMGVPAADDTRKASQRRAEAVVDIFAGRTRVEPRIDVRVDLDVLAGNRPDLVDGLCDVDPHGPAGRSMIEALLCDCAVGRVLMRGKSQVIDVGTQTRTVPSAMRRALAVRDQHCRYPGCSRPHRMCDAHHIIEWEHGGPTCLENLVLLCRRHHVYVHRKQMGISLEADGTVEFRAPP